MQKVVDFLEKYCQWLAVGIAALFFLFALWQFLPGVSTPVTREIGGIVHGPGDVDRVILETAETLQTKINAPDKIKDAVPAYGPRFTADLTKPPTVRPILPAALLVRNFPIPENLVPDEKKIANPSAPASELVQELPKLPAPNLEAPTTGFAQVAAPGGNAAPVQPVIATPPGQPAPAPAVNAKDVTWVRVPYVIPTRQVLFAFQQANLPPSLMPTGGVVRVELLRERALAGGQWDAEEVVKAFSVVVPLQQEPAAGSSPNLFLDFKTWAFANQPAILQPSFFQIVGGEDPSVTKPEEKVAVEVFDPTTFPRSGDVAKLTPEQRKAVMDARKEAAKTKPAATPRGGGASSGKGARGGGGGGRGPAAGEGAPRIALPDVQPGEPIELQYRPSAANGVPPGGGDGGTGGDPGMAGDATPAAPAPGQPITLPQVPPAPWDPRLAGNGLGDIYGVAYDVDARGDSTYRYRVRYFLANPLFQTNGVAANPQLATVFELVGEDPAKWTDPIEIAPRSYVFLAAQPLTGATSVRFEVYHWQDGKQHKVIQAVSTGDSIGKPESNIDYRTPWTFVEVRRDPSNNNVYALLMNSEGKERRSVFAVDQALPLRKRLATQVDAATAAAGTANATPATGGRPGVPAAGAGVAE